MPTSAADASGTARDELLALHRAGRIAAEYPLVTRLVGELSRDELPWAGQLLARVGPDKVLAEHASAPTVSVAVTGHGTLSTLIPALTAETARHGLLLRPFVADFDSYVFDLSDPQSQLYAARADLVLCVLDPAVVFDEVPVPWTPQDVDRVAAGKLTLLKRLIGTFEQASGATLVLNTVPLPRHAAGQLVDHRSRARLGAVWREFNAGLLRLCEDHPALVVLDLDPLLADGVAASDARLEVYAKTHLGPELLARYAREVGHLARHVTGRTRKCLVLDLDDTLWGGVLGEDGPEGIEVADGLRGEAFRSFQRVVKQIGSQGVLLAAISKNDPEPVRAVLRDHPGMTVREEDFVRIIADWRPKTANLAELAEALNLGTDSFVLVDDSAYERGLVRRELPGVVTIGIDDEPALHAERLLSDGWFDARDLTGEDRARPARYRDEIARKSFLDNFDSIGDYLRELAIEVRFCRAAEAEVARVSQLTLRTNQFNLTTVRLQPPDVRQWLDDPAALVATIRSADRFGDNGLVGAVFARREAETMHIENFLLSCRVFSRGIEQACLASLLEHARATGAAAVTGSYRRTAKNHAVADFYPRHGFEPAGSGGGETVSFRHDLLEIASPPEHIQLTVNLEGKPA